MGRLISVASFVPENLLALPGRNMANSTLCYDSLLHRVGELISHFGRYDMYALLLEQTLISSQHEAKRQRPRNLLNRGKVIERLLAQRELPARLRSEFHTINVEFNASLSRNEISARNPAVVGSLTLVPGREMPMLTAAKDWFDCAGSAPSEINSLMDLMEREIVNVVSLYMRLAALVHEVRAILRRIH
jgi:hypothetical protein